MVKPVRQSGTKSYGVNQYAVDTESELKNLPTYCEMGSSAIVIETGAVYILNSKKQWIKQPSKTAGGNGSGSTSGEDDIVVINDASSSSNDDSIVIL